MVTFGFLDWFWLILFILLMVGCGILFYRLGKRSESDFFLAGRGLPWWLPASSVYASHTATDTPMWVSGVIYKYGLAGLWYTFFAGWCAVSAFVSTRIFRRSLAYTQAEWQTLRFGGLSSELLRGWVAGWQVFMNMFILGWVGIAMGIVCRFAFGWPAWVGLIVFSSVCAIYVLAAGYWGVVMADFQQGVIALIVILIVSIWGISAAGGPGEIVAKLQSMGEGWRLNPFSFTGFFTGDFPAAWFITMLVIAVIGGLGMGTSIDWYTEAQRIQSSKTVKDASYSIWAGTALVLVRNSIWAAAILGFFVLYPEIQDVKDYELAWFRIGFENLPTGMLGFFFAAIVAIHISTISTQLNLGSVYITWDLYHHYINPKASQQKLVWVGRVSTVILLLGSFVFVASVFAFSTHDTVISRRFDKTEAPTNRNINVTVTFRNLEADDLRGFYYTEHVPEGLTVNTLNLRIFDGDIETEIAGYTLEFGASGDVYPGYVPYRWILETPPQPFIENNLVFPNAELEILYFRF